MRWTILTGVVLSVVLVLFVSWQAAPVTGAAPGPETSNASQTPTPVLVELFTSEGCSSCPPADALLARLESSQPVAGAVIIPLKEHVDYWNRLGWTDRFSSAELTQRQARYADSVSHGDIYTPQMVVDGESAFVGSDETAARQAIARASQSPKARVEVMLKQDSLKEIVLTTRVSELAEADAKGKPEVLLAITESGLTSDVKRGENQGRKLSHVAVVRELRVVGKVGDNGRFEKEVSVPLASEWKRENLTAVVFVQEPGRRVLGAARLSLSGHR